MKRLMKKGMLFVLMITCLMVFTGNAYAKTRVSLSSKKVTLCVGDKTTLRLTGAKAKKVKWSSSNKKVATVNRKGIVTAKKAGKAVITAKYGKKKYRAKITVVKAAANATRTSKKTTSSTPTKTVNEFYNPNNYIMADNCINIMPYHIYYKDRCLYAECYVINGFWRTVYNINVSELTFFNGNGKIASGSFGIIAGGSSISARSYETYTFIFDPGYYVPGAVLNSKITCRYECYNR